MYPHWRSVVSLGVALLMAGCSTGTVSTPASTGEPSAESGQGVPKAAQTDENQSMLDRIARDFGLGEVPEVPVVRVTTPEDRDGLIRGCMAEQGFAPDAEGNYTYPQAQDRAFGMATYTCWARYPLHQRYWGGAPSQDQREKLYRYWVDVRMPCLRRLGYTIPDPPTMEAWLGGQEWAPHYFAVPKNRADEEEVERLCPATPPGYYN